MEEQRKTKSKLQEKHVERKNSYGNPEEYEHYYKENLDENRFYDDRPAITPSSNRRGKFEEEEEDEVAEIDYGVKEEEVDDE
jgi:hypothetical protein